MSKQFVRTFNALSIKPAWAVMVVLATLILSSGCGRRPATAPPPAPTGAPIEVAPTPTLAQVQLIDDGSPLLPRVISRLPEKGELLSLNGFVELTFNQPMDQESTAQAWQLVDSQGEGIPGELQWVSPRAFRFKPDQALTAGSSYTARLATSARSSAGILLDEAYEFDFQTVQPLQISQVYPPDGALGIETQAVITVVFNKPVVPLVTSAEQVNLPNPLEIAPALDGRGEWVNTSIFVFRPESYLRGGANYQVTVKAGLADAAGETRLESDYSWTFTTMQPGIDGFWLTDYPWDVNPQGSRRNIPLKQGFAIRFLQPMDRASVEENLNIISLTNERAPLEFTWGIEDTLVVFTPTQPLSLGTSYWLKLDRAALAKDGGQLTQGIDWRFTTVPYPRVVGTEPADGTVQDYFSEMLRIEFASPMRFATLKDKVIIEPPLTGNWQWYYEECRSYGGDCGMYTFGLQPSTRYTVRILPGMEDIYGYKTQEEKVVTFYTAAYQPSAYFQMPLDGPVMYRTGGLQEFYLAHRNIRQAEIKLSRLPIKTFAALQVQYGEINLWNYRPDANDLVWQKSLQSTAVLNERVLQRFQMTQSDGSPLAPGVYFLTLNSPQVSHGESLYDDLRLLVVASVNLTFKTTNSEALVWATDLTTGEPVSGVPIAIYNTNWELVGNAVSDPQGLAYVAGLKKGSEWYDTFFALAEGNDRFGFAAGNWASGVSPYDFGIWQDYYSRAGMPRAYLYTDRPLYRPDQPVYFKGVLRLDDDLKYALPDQTQVNVTIESYEEVIYQKTLPLTEFGSFSGSLLLDKEAALGVYSIKARFPGQELVLGEVSFNVAEYRKPEFLVEVKASPENVLAGGTFNVSMQADYYAGGPLVNAQVAWDLRAAPFTFSPPDEYSGYSFTDSEWDICYACFDRGYYDEIFIAEGKAQLDENGHLELTLPAELKESKNSQQFRFEAVITDFAGVSVAGRTTVVVHRSGVYPGIRSREYVGQINQPITFELAALDWSGQPLGRQVVDVEIVERRWYSVQEQDAQGRVTWSSSVEEIPVTYFEGVRLDERGLGRVSFTPASGGVFRARVIARDAFGNAGQASTFLWVAGEDYIPWRQTNDRSMTLVADRGSYSPGDTAEILIASPFEGERFALATIERGHLYSYQVLRMTSNSTIYRLPITADMAPVTYVSVLVIKGAELNKPPDFRMGLVKINVDRREQALQVDIIPDKETASPGSQVNFMVRTRNAAGEPVAAEVSLGLSDLAALSLSEPNSQPILDFFYYERGLSVWTAVPIVYMIENYNITLESGFQPEGEQGGAGGGKGAGEEGIVKVRGYFPDTAYWSAHVLTGEDGEASVTVTLPDNLTTWRMDARAVSGGKAGDLFLVGQAQKDIISSKPLLVRPQTPRFFTAGDRVSLGAAVHNNTEQDLQVTVSLEANGIQLEGAAQQVVEIAARRQGLVTWWVNVPLSAQRADLVFKAEAGEYADASLPPVGTLDNQGIPVYRYDVPETVGTSGVMLEGGRRIEAVSLPAGWDVQAGELKVEIAPSLVAGMTAGLRYLEHYPYECTEQTISRFLPNVAVARALRAAGLSDPAVEAGLEEQVNLGLQRLYSQQNADGGWGWWGGRQKSDSLTSAYVLLGLDEAAKAGYVVSQPVVVKATAYLRSQLLSLNTLPEQHLANRQAFILYVLARVGLPRVSDTVKLYDVRQNLALYARAFLAETLFLIDADDPRLQALLADFNSAAVLSASGAHWEEVEPDYHNWNTDTRTTAIILKALIKLDQQSPLTVNGVRWLMNHRSQGHWGSTQETAWTLMALTDWMTASGELQANYSYAVAFNGQEIASGLVQADNLQEATELRIDLADMLREEVNRLAILRQEGAGNLYYTAFLNLQLPVEQVEAVNRGIEVSRQYYRVDDYQTPITQASQGDLVLVRLTVVAPKALHYVVVSDPLPAGLEAVDQSLATSPQNEQPQSLRWEDVMGKGWGWWYFEHVEMRDEKVVLSAVYLPAGTYIYTYLARAASPGQFRVIPPTAQEFYFPDVYGRGAGSLFDVEPSPVTP